MKLSVESTTGIIEISADFHKVVNVYNSVQLEAENVS